MGMRLVWLLEFVRGEFAEMGPGFEETSPSVSSAASDELQRDSELQRKNEEKEAKQQSMNPPALLKPPPPPPIVKKSTTKVSPVFTNNSVEAREALMEAIRSGSGASKLKKVSVSVHTL
ncbi:cordon-bleu [Pelobates cultripes]|uniref:Cordon-bleu, partial n=1 Tax=Pelobates cultripes TaxID=61616 RepID=A0AAD1W466_PELCU|nr:cordon-bleu [Pelobates cultripes]